MYIHYPAKCSNTQLSFARLWWLDAGMSNFGQEIHLIGPRDGDKECDDNVKAKSLSALVSVFL